MRIGLQSSSFQSTSFVWAQAFAPGESLYRDHHGRRVVADCEGGGIVEVIGTGPFDFEVDESQTEPGCAPVRFGQSVVVTTKDEGALSVRVSRDSNFDHNLADEVTFEGLYEGCGWLLECNADCRIDSLHQSPAKGSPFFQSVSGWVKILPVQGIRSSIVDEFSFADAEALKKRSFEVTNVSEIQTLESLFSDGTPLTAQHISHLNTAQWRISLPPENLGIRIRKLYDKFHGRQRARVLIDGQNAGWWYLPEEDRHRRWGEAEFGVPAQFTAGKNTVKIAIDPPPASPLWSVASIQVLALLPA